MYFVFELPDVILKCEVWAWADFIFPAYTYFYHLSLKPELGFKGSGNEFLGNYERIWLIKYRLLEINSTRAKV